MLRIRSELMRQRRIQLGLTSEELAEKSGLDARTIRRLEQGKTHPRLHTVTAVAQALTLDIPNFVLNQKGELSFQSNLLVDESDDDERRLAAAFRAAENTFRTKLTYEGHQSFREVMYVVSLLLTKALATEGNELAEKEDEGVREVVAAFKAADVAIRKTLSGGGDLDIEDATCVFSLLLTRYGIAFSRQSESDPMEGFSMIENAFNQAKKAFLDYLTLGFVDPGETSSGEEVPGPESLQVDERMGDTGGRVRLTTPSR